jgi:hypothetical protein
MRLNDCKQELQALLVFDQTNFNGVPVIELFDIHVYYFIKKIVHRRSTAVTICKSSYGNKIAWKVLRNLYLKCRRGCSANFCDKWKDNANTICLQQKRGGRDIIISCLLAKTSRVAPASLCKIEVNTGIKYPESQCLTFPRYQ